MIDPDHPRLSIMRQCDLASISRSSFYREPTAESEETLRLMRLIDEQFLETPWYGSRQMARHLRRQGWCVGRHRVRRLVAKMGLAPIYQHPKTSEPHPHHKVYPYLLRHLTIDRPNQVWCADVTYIQMRRGFLYLVAIMDWARKVLAWRLSSTMDAEFCVAALEEAIACYGPANSGIRARVSRARESKVSNPICWPRRHLSRHQFEHAQCEIRHLSVTYSNLRRPLIRALCKSCFGTERDPKRIGGHR
jgi:transposase InsO family protein